MPLQVPEGPLRTLAEDQWVSLGVGESSGRLWYRGHVQLHDDTAGRLVLTCYLDRSSDPPLLPGQRVVISAEHGEDAFFQAPMDVEDSSTGPTPTVMLRLAGAWQVDQERRLQVRVRLDRPVLRARRWFRGAWRELSASIVDLSSRGVGLRLEQEVALSDRLALAFALDSEIHANTEVRHVRRDGDTWRAGAVFRTLAPEDHERVIRFIFAELRTH